MDMGTAVAIIGTVTALSLGGANIFKTLYAKNFCEQHRLVSEELMVIKKEQTMLIRLAETTDRLEEMMEASKIDRQILHNETRNVYSHIGDIRTVLSLMAYEQMQNSPNLKLIQDLLKRKSCE
jgi:hypothetical protein